MSENSKRPKPILFGCAGTRLTTTERRLFKEANPFGIILFKRNCETPDQVRYLVLELQQAVGHNKINIAIDQEGGRVARLQPPHWPKYPSARTFGLMYEREPEWGLEAIKLYSRILAHELVKLGFTINCAPVVDLFNPQGTLAIGDRAFSEKPAMIAALARVQVDTFLANGILPVMKHLPGHGKLKVDPHHVLPYIDATRADLEEADFIPFSLLDDIPLGMNSHAIFTALDPKNPASLSSIINQEIIRNTLGFKGLLLSDDLTMKALKGNVADLALRALDVGNDIILHCSGDTSEMEVISRAVEPMNDTTWSRWTKAESMVGTADKVYNPLEDAARLDVLLGGHAFEDNG